jgi:hypothetical protein
MLHRPRHSITITVSFPLTSAATITRAITITSTSTSFDTSHVRAHRVAARAVCVVRLGRRRFGRVAPARPRLRRRGASCVRGQAGEGGELAVWRSQGRGAFEASCSTRVPERRWCWCSARGVGRRFWVCACAWVGGYGSLPLASPRVSDPRAPGRFAVGCALLVLCLREITPVVGGVCVAVKEDLSSASAWWSCV